MLAVTKCEQCGATIDPTVYACPYCHLTTPAGVVARNREEAAQRAQQQWQQAVQYQNKQATLMQVNATANQSLLFSIIGVALCCFPIGVVGIIQGVRARGMAKALSVEVPPAKATIGLVLGVVSCLVSVAVITGAAISSANDEKAAAARIVELDKLIGTKNASPTLDHTVACEIAEASARKTGHSGTLGSSLKDFDCVGKLTQTADAATLEDFKLASAGDHYKVFVCFKHGAVWYVSEMREDGCDPTATNHDDDAAADGTSAATASTHRSTPPRRDVAGAAHDAGAVAPHHDRDAH